ncbi:MAG: DUF116 domain-containing protein [Anaerolineales bacterium]|nr:DUF116 domain-containing protein [Anaerolineales bacterium]
MLEVITYSLRNGLKHSHQYYLDIAALSDRVLAEVLAREGRLVNAFRDFIHESEREAPRSQSEYAYELLALGVLWQVYAARAVSLPGAPGRALAGLARLRQSSERLKPAIDWLRGVLISLFLSPQGADETPPEADLDSLERLLGWLEASGDFTQEIKRLYAWRDFLACQPPSQTQAYLHAAIDLAAWFERQSLAALGAYTPNVERFLAETHPGYRWREDAIFCGRRRVEYHLAMLGAQVLNRAFRQDFLHTQRKLVLLPPCMRAKQDGCQARQTPLGERCAGCTPSCRVHQATRLGEKHGFDVLIMPHELSVFSSGGIKPTSNGSVGVVGVSCPLTNVAGGWETKDLGVPAQGLLLDYCGCPWHWHPQGIPTDIDFDQLLRVLDCQGLVEIDR